MPLCLDDMTGWYPGNNETTKLAYQTKQLMLSCAQTFRHRFFFKLGIMIDIPKL